MNSDVIFAKAKAHKVCQDYGLADIDDNGNPYVIISDGCSGAKNSDWGSRIITKSAEEIWLENWSHNQISLIELAELKYDGLSNSIFLKKSNKLNRDLLAATCLFSGINGKSENYLSMMGDGCFVIREKDKLTIIVREYSSGAPFYPYYLLDPSLKNGYLSQFKGFIRDTFFIKLDSDINFSIKFLEKEISSESYLTGTLPLSLEIPTHNLLWTAILSDGIHSFKKPGLKGQNPIKIPITEIVPMLLDFKTYAGEFVYRNINFILNDLYKNGWFHEDDFSCGVTYFGE